MEAGPDYGDFEFAVGSGSGEQPGGEHGTDTSFDYEDWREPVQGTQRALSRRGGTANENFKARSVCRGGTHFRAGPHRVAASLAVETLS